MRKRDKKRDKAYRDAKAAKHALGNAESVSAIFAVLVKYQMCTEHDLGFMFGFLRRKVHDLIVNPLSWYRSDDVTELKKLIMTLFATFYPPSVCAWMHMKSAYLGGRTPVKVFGKRDGPQKVRAAFKDYEDSREGYI